jgi:benzoyl-CoA reductase/2-hydroxyglutaryl-CoA dehydratase subunit BcrC/BadD/HgdB
MDCCTAKPVTTHETDPFTYFRSSVADEVDFIRSWKKKGGKVAGIYCEFTPRDLFLAGGMIPVCLCGTSQQTIAPAETVLPANLCPLIKSSYGYILTNRCPFATAADLIVGETTCDGKKKMFEILAEKKPTHILELTQKVNETEAFDHWLAEIRKLKAVIESIIGREITDSDLSGSIRAMNRERALLLEIFELGKHNPPIVSGKELSMIRYRVAGFPRHLQMLEAFLHEIKTRAASGYLAAPASAPRVMLTGCPTGHGSEKVIEVIEECGGIVVVQETCSGVKPLFEPVSEEGDPLVAIARKFFNLPCSCMTPNTGRTALLERLANDYHIHAIVDLVWQACHTYNVESYFIDRFSRETLNLPYLKIETDYSPSDREQLKVRIQTLLEISA